MSHVVAVAVALAAVGILLTASVATVRLLLVVPVIAVLAVLVIGAIAVLVGPALLGYHHCDVSDYLLGAHGFRLLGTALCKS